MKLFNLFGRKEKETPPQESGEANDGQELDIYSGMRVEVTNFDGGILFFSLLLRLRGDKAELHQYSETSLPGEGEPFPVRIRGYSDYERKAVYMEGIITPAPERVWSVEELKVCKTGNDRAFFRLSTDLDATAEMFSGLHMGEKPCRLLNISIGGACISSEYRYHEGDKFLLKVRLLKERPESAMFAEVVRVTEKENSPFEYGCRFLELNDADQEKITQNIFEAQRQKRKRM